MKGKYSASTPDYNVKQRFGRDASRTDYRLTLNDSKTEFMIIGSRHHLTKFEDIPEISLAIRENNIKRVTNKKSLGFIIDDQLKWGIHIDAQCKKISKNIALLRRAKSFVPLHILIKMYNSLFIIWTAVFYWELKHS